MKRLLLTGILIFIPALAPAQFHDHDGVLEIQWSPPAFGTPLDHYEWSYTINGVADSIQGEASANDSSNNAATLGNIGDWAIFRIRSISVVNDTSVWAVSDTVIYNTDSGIGPPRGVTWTQGP